MFKKVLIGLLAVAIMAGIFKAGVEFGQYLRDRQDSSAAAE